MVSKKIEKVEISHRTIIFTIAFLFSLWLIYFLRDIVLLTLVSVLLSLSLSSSVDKLERKIHLPRFLAILLTYFFILGLIVSSLVLLANPLINQTNLLIDQFFNLFNRISRTGVNQLLAEFLKNPLPQISSFSGNIFRFTQGLVGNAVKIFSILVISFYLILERPNLRRHLLFFLSPQKAALVEDIVSQIEKDLGSWLWGELILMIIVGFLTYLGLLLAGIKYALPLAFLAGVLEIFPNIGPVLASLPGIIIGLSLSPLMALKAAAVYLIVQQLENSFIVPKVMQKAVGVHPIITLLALLAGFRFAGVAGAIFSLPVILAIKVIFKNWLVRSVKSKK